MRNERRVPHPNGVERYLNSVVGWLDSFSVALSPDITDVISTSEFLRLRLAERIRGCNHYSCHRWSIMATAAMSYGERRFGAAYTGRIVLALGVLGLLVGLWAAQNDPRSSAHPNLVWVSIGLMATVVALWVVLGKSALIINDFGVRRESVRGQQEIAWSQIVETRYRIVPINVYAQAAARQRST